MGRFYDLIQQHIDAQPYEVSARKIAKKLGVTQTAMTNWQHPKGLIEKRHIVAVAELAGVRYERALEALLDDIGYRTERDDRRDDQTA